jgi:hypothetical protein
MAKTFSQKMKELRHVAKLHANWLIYATLGESAVTKEELDELIKYKKLPMGSSLDLVDKSYLLGRLKAILKASEYKQVSYEEATEKTESMKLSSLEELVVEQVKLKAGTYLKNLSTEINNGVYDSLSQAIGKAVSEAAVSNAVADEVALAVIYKKTAQQLASDLAARLQTGAKKNWTAVAKTELQRAKVAGHAQAIINKIDIYANSDGVNSDVSIIPAKECCSDCRDHYLDAKGNPKVFKLADLLSAGSNADDGVSHTKRNGKHTNWKTTLPPLHPNCGCQLFYIPPGYGWKSGKMELLNKSLFEESILRKARSGVRSAEMSATITPKGPPKPPEPAGGTSGGGTGGRPPAGGGMAAPAGAGGGGNNNKYSPCPFGGGEECSKHGGDGAENHEIGGEIFQAHMAAIAQGAKSTNPEAQKEQKDQAEAASAAYDAVPHPVAVIADYLESGKIASAKQLGRDDDEKITSLHVSFFVNFQGKGSGCMKPPPAFPPLVADGYGYADGLSNAPKGAGHLSEKAAYHVATWLGLDDHVPVTVVREHNGTDGISYEGEMSVQHWQDDSTTLPGLDKKGINSYKDIIDAAPPEHKERLKKKFRELACLDFIINNNDRHIENIVVKQDLSDIRGIDHGLSFGSGLEGHKNGLQNSMHRAGENLTVPDHLFARLKAQSFDQTKRQLEGVGLQDWQVANVHLRMKYLVHLQEQHGEIPIEATRYATCRVTSEEDFMEDQMSETTNRYVFPDKMLGWQSELVMNPERERVTKGKYTDESLKARKEEIDKTEANWEMPNQLFAKFAKEYISGGLNSDLTKDEKDEMYNSRVLIPTGTGIRNGGSIEARTAYWNSIPSWKPMNGWGKAEARIAPVRVAPEVPEQSGISEKQILTRGKKVKRQPVDPEAKTYLGRPLTPFEAERTQLELYDESGKGISEPEEMELSEEDIEPIGKSLYLSKFNVAFPLDNFRWE